MKHILALFALLSMLCTAAMAQTLDLSDLDFEHLDEPGDTYTFFETEEETVIVTEMTYDTENPDFVYKPNQQGDQFVRLNLALEIPAKPKQLKLGGAGTIGLSTFLNENLIMGAKASFSYSNTIGGNVFYFVPIVFTTGYQFLFNKVEVPLSLDVGIAMESYIDRLYFGLVVKPEAAIFFRVAPDWSVGAFAGMFILPQIYSNSEYNRVGFISDVGLTARYHF